MRHVAHIHASCRTCECTISHVRNGHVSHFCSHSSRRAQPVVGADRDVAFHPAWCTCLDDGYAGVRDHFNVREGNGPESFCQGIHELYLQCVAVCCSVLQCVAVCCSVLQCVAVCCSVLQCVKVCCSVVAVLLQCVVACCSVLQCVAVCCSALQSRHT